MLVGQTGCKHVSSHSGQWLPSPTIYLSEVILCCLAQPSSETIYLSSHNCEKKASCGVSHNLFLVKGNFVKCINK